MDLSSVRGLTAALIVACPGFALAVDSVPDIKGKWTGKTHSIVAGSGGHWPKAAGTFAKPALLEKDVVMEVTGQEGRRFWGLTTIAGGGEKTSEPFIGELAGKDNKTIAIADTDGYFNGQLSDADTFGFCYMHAGGKTKSTVVSCAEVKRIR